MSEKTEAERISSLEAWAFRAGRDLADIKNRLDRTATVASVDALHQDVTEMRGAMTEGFDHLNARLDTVAGELTEQRRLLEAILERLPQP